MSLGSDFISDNMYDIVNPFGIDYKYWITKSGERVKPEDMSTKHIIKCINVVKDVDPDWEDIFLDIIKTRNKTLYYMLISTL